LDQDFLDRTAGNNQTRMPQEKVKEIIQDYIALIPDFEHSSGALCYFRGSSYASDYLTVYVYWALRMAREKFPALETGGQGFVDNAKGYFFIGSNH